MKIGILTSTETRHRYFVNRIRAAHPVAAVVYEKTGYVPATVGRGDLTRDEARVVAEHFAERTRLEEFYFGHQAEKLGTDGCAVRDIEKSALNSEETIRFLDGAGVDTVVVYGTDLIRPPLLGHFPGRMVNMHLGLSPYYRGTATNFYPLLNGEPEYIGATIHLISEGIDDGPILRHARPDIVADDMPHTIGCKAIDAGIDAMIEVLKAMAHDAVHPIPQWKPENAKLYLRKDYHPRHVVKLYQKIKDGLIPDYVKRAEQVAPRVLLVE